MDNYMYSTHENLCYVNGVIKEGRNSVKFYLSGKAVIEEGEMTMY